MAGIFISGFADEIDNDFKLQLQTVTGLGMRYISLRSAYGKNIGNYTWEEVQAELLPLLKEYGVGVSSLGSPIGKVKINDPEAVAKQRDQLEELCRIAKGLECRYIRMFSFYTDEEKPMEEQREAILQGLRDFIAIAAAHDIVLIHENEKDIYGDNLARNVDLMNELAGPHFGSAFDFANFVQCGEDTWECWQAMQPFVRYIHIKDAVSHDNENVLFGTGEGQGERILAQAIKNQGYEGFLTLEPHLVIFDSLKQLEIKDAGEVIKENKAESGADGYRMTYEALTEILERNEICFE
ncbi:MAG: sugar phosphate isomerase/epimerase [Trichococcus flocculiformis]|uniref:Sugar phosphate isomerase/epimerase n=1 Tax=Trichococcus flocculiformis TaxID=82803 RepID=A0A847D3Z9_9LACT|nr:TIM barrel protein [Trichococcus flocculiformis]NCC83384.1 sugar phosphate isomerase/epimerase [Clostridia bacterium]NLD31398.1 sugar phosphate isomerase/epimerase [Trichococcus flocculiformis]